MAALNNKSAMWRQATLRTAIVAGVFTLFVAFMLALAWQANVASNPTDHPKIEQLRNEAHRFALMGHRKKRGAARQKSPLQQIPGVGEKRRRELLRQFGGLQELQSASLEEIAKVKWEDLNANDIEMASRIIAGTARSMGITVEG